MLEFRTAGLAARQFRDTMTQVWRILRTLFNQVVGFVFLVLAGWGALWLIRNFREFDGDGETLFKMALVGVFVLMMSSFGIRSEERRVGKECRL